jgi:hypothetical protein
VCALRSRSRRASAPIVRSDRHVQAGFRSLDDSLRHVLALVSLRPAPGGVPCARLHPRRFESQCSLFSSSLRPPPRTGRARASRARSSPRSWSIRPRARRCGRARNYRASGNRWMPAGRGIARARALPATSRWLCSGIPRGREFSTRARTPGSSRARTRARAGPPRIRVFRDWRSRPSRWIRGTPRRSTSPSTITRAEEGCIGP